MKKRVISAAVAIAILVLVLIYKGPLLYVSMGLLAVQAYREMMGLKNGIGHIPFVMKALGIFLTLGLVYSTFEGYSIVFGLSYKVVGLCAILLLLPAIFIKKDYSCRDAFYNFGLTIFLGFVFNSLLLVINNDVHIFIYLILITILTDTFAMLIGKLIGKHPLIPSVSPNKTFEGSIAGSLVGTIIAVVYYYNMINNTSLFLIIVITLFLSVMGQLGDLMFSKIKRENEIKDYSNIMPGHGGILDRLDSIIFVTITYLLFFTII